uniref:Protein kinase domain-containing protein n=1 Tax=Oryza punctata TaxID=4537 RepID=A0A0E0MJ96_ORYPU
MTSSLATFVLLVIITLSSSSRPCPRRVDAAREWLARGASIAVEDHASDVLHSPDGTFAAGFYDASPTVFTFSVWFARAADRAVVWTAARARPNGSLAQKLFGRDGLDDVLDWNQRFRIALGVAKGLAYLHSECSEWIVHCDMKPENILLDKDLEPKITDFGLSKLLNRDGSDAILTRIRGTRGYMAPEWVTNLPVTEKVDVYSYGVILLELVKGIRISEWVIHGIKVCEMDIRMVVRATRQIMKMGSNDERSIEDLVDHRLNGDFNHVQLKMMLEIAVSCLEEDRSKRPNMNSVVQALISVEAISSSPRHLQAEGCENEKNIVMNKDGCYRNIERHLGDQFPKRHSHCCQTVKSADVNCICRTFTTADKAKIALSKWNVAIRYTQGLTVEVTVFPCVRILVKQLPCLAAVPFPASFLLHTTVSGGYRSGQTPTQAS